MGLILLFGVSIEVIRHYRLSNLQSKQYLLEVTDNEFIFYPNQKKEKRIPHSSTSWTLRKYANRVSLVLEDQEVEIDPHMIHPEDWKWLEENLPQVEGFLPHWLAPKQPIVK